MFAAPNRVAGLKTRFSHDFGLPILFHMRIALVIFVLAVGCFFSVSPGHPPDADAPIVPFEAPLAFETTSIDLGPIPDTQSITRAFRFTNVSKQVARLVIGGCHHCGVPTSDKPAYKPGESGVIIVELNPAGRRGEIRAGGNVRVEGVTGYSVSIDLLAEVRPRVWFDPEPGAFPATVRGVGGTVKYQVSGREPGFHIERASVSGEHWHVSVSDPEKAGTPDDPWITQTLTLSVDPAAPTGPLAGLLSVTMADPFMPARTFALSTDIGGDAVAQPDPVMLGNVPAGSAFAARFHVKSRRDQPVQVLDVEVADSGQCTSVAVDLVPASDLHGWTVRVTGYAPTRRINSTDVVVALRSVGADGQPETLRFNTRLSVRPDRAR